MSIPEPRRALLVVDVPRDFCEGGSLAVAGGAALAGAITEYGRRHRDGYSLIVASRDWHDPGGSNRGHLALPPEEPDFASTWPAHCVAGSPGADYQPGFDTGLVDVHVRKGLGYPAYSMFEGSDTGEAGGPVAGSASLAALLERRGVTEVDVVGIATDYCCLATAQSALAAGLRVRVRRDLQAGVAAATSAAALTALEQAGATVVAAAAREQA